MMSKRVLAIAAVVLAFGATVAIAVVIWPDRNADDGSRSAAATTDPTSDSHAGPAEAAGTSADGIAGNSKADKLAPGGVTQGVPQQAIGAIDSAADARFALQPAADPALHPRLKHPPAAGVLFDIDSGEVLWQRQPTTQRPIASLTKMMTALLVAESDPPGAKVTISPKASSTPGSATGLLPRGKRVPLEPLLQALIMISANDAAVALAEHDAGTETAFIKEMNAKAQEMGLSCTHFSTPNGLKDRDNYSCPLDLAALARADLADQRIAHIAETRYAKPAFPIKGGHLHLANNHYFLQRGLGATIPGAQVTGLKTGFTDGAGRCYVTTAHLGSHNLGVVVLDSPDPLRQVPALLRAGFEELGDLQAKAPTKPKLQPPND
jgi:serine-type D-Ala-D-Ala carboxypeptidase (penicillin-binding protein 5/6)